MVLKAAAPLHRLFLQTGEDERDPQLLDDLGLSGVQFDTTTLFFSSQHSEYSLNLNELTVSHRYRKQESV